MLRALHGLCYKHCYKHCMSNALYLYLYLYLYTYINLHHLCLYQGTIYLRST